MHLIHDDMNIFYLPIITVETWGCLQNEDSSPFKQFGDPFPFGCHWKERHQQQKHVETWIAISIDIFDLYHFYTFVSLNFKKQNTTLFMMIMMFIFSNKKRNTSFGIDRNKTSMFHMSHVQNPVDIPLYWLVNRDPYTVMAYDNPNITGYNWVVKSFISNNQPRCWTLLIYADFRHKFNFSVGSVRTFFRIRFLRCGGIHVSSYYPGFL